MNSRKPRHFIIMFFVVFICIYCKLHVYLQAITVSRLAAAYVEPDLRVVTIVVCRDGLQPVCLFLIVGCECLFVLRTRSVIQRIILFYGLHVYALHDCTHSIVILNTYVNLF